MVLDGGGHFNPGGIDGVHTLTLLFSSHTALDRAEGNPHTNNNQHRQTDRQIERGYRNLTNTRVGMNSVPL